MGLRDNFRQALDEMIGSKSAEAASLDELPAADPGQSEAGTDRAESIAIVPPQSFAASSATKEPGSTPVKSLTHLVIHPGQNPGAKTIITTGTSLKGDLSCQSDLDIQGIVVGHVKSEGLIRVTGKVEGDIACENLELDNAEIKGQIRVSKHLVVRGETRVTGNLTGEQMEINGKIKGNISVNATLHLLSKASVVGDIHACNIQIDSGAMVFGHLNITSSSEGQVEPESILEK